MRIGPVLTMAIVPWVTARADEPPRGLLEGRVVSGATLAPIEGATVVVTSSDGGPLVVSGTTDAGGWFRYRLPPGSYDALAIFGESRWVHRNLVVAAAQKTQAVAALAVEPGEVVTVHEKAPAAVTHAAQPVRSTVKRVLSYSDEAMDRNLWAVGWVLLDVDERGVVTGFRFLHRPGNGLDEVTEREIWSLTFEPARDERGAPMATKVLWKLEWPPFHWAKDHKLTGLGAEGAVTPANHDEATLEAAADGQIPGSTLAQMSAAQRRQLTGMLGPGSFVLPDGEHKPPCRGQAGLNLDFHEPVYRDCTPPDLTKINTEALVPRPRR